MLKAKCLKCHWKGGIFGKDPEELSSLICPRCLEKGFLVPKSSINLKVSTARGAEFLKFASKVLAHVEHYTVPQYGDAPDDPISEWTAEDCVRAIQKRTNRFKRQAREGQDKLDLLKIAHEACVAYNKL